jgi:hypothetical protein
LCSSAECFRRGDLLMIVVSEVLSCEA